ncbi:hypothetical protein Cs7R123_11770 [Catellatospora sp. TT07R-123]|uniref:SAM-dependent methyltransferase n=1 Tax=Catellatospora sp. TT07R-123 TaxID=2733863 RepID=UPI001B06EA5D|nr:class I SAM-dependent methyltransferase [Catellatospora sp. TT07R-123]GHJ43835.1 hypothetical protein Cs7R123_11770 [Catellatospora sp. TT07R-123]
MTETYTVTAEFYDLLQAAQHRAVTVPLLDRWLGRPVVGVLDVGAGTGLDTVLLAERCDVTVHAVEPSSTMRAVLLGRLTARADLLARVRVHAREVERLGLAGVADFAWCRNTVSGFDTAGRAAALAAMATALVPGGRLVVQRPPAVALPDRGDLPSVLVGGDLYSGELTTTPVGDQRVRWRFAYRVSRDGALVRQEDETFEGHVVTPEAFARELAAAGFTVEAEDIGDTVVARRVA